MKFYIAFTFVLALIAVVLSGPAQERQNVPEDDKPNMEYFLVETSDGHYRIEDLVNAELDTRASASDVTYHYYSRSTPSGGVLVRNNDVSVLRNTDYSVSRATLLIIHGWNNNKDSAVNTHIKEAILSKYNINVFVVDWGTIANKNYVSARNSVSNIGIFVADFVRSLVSNYSLRLGTVACVGHSLGAHVCGNAGASLRGQIDHIVGLDPASPLFTLSNTGNRLDPTDAHYVQIIHTNGGLLGFEASIGHSDYFPNGGKSQPGCGIDIAGTCAHSRAYIYYAEAILAHNNRFISRKCPAYSDFSSGRCTSNGVSFMGGFELDYEARGDYFLNTNNAALYAQG